MVVGAADVVEDRLRDGNRVAGLGVFDPLGSAGADSAVA